ncbi:MAG: peptidoglycan binding domain-containing protein [Clostridium sp.]|nr:peptidoglycan binding domain-containing protein [Clostridium sp.]MBQ9014151.1 peptidoglycan binding domain-containing protein [Bacilli bacterium]
MVILVNNKKNSITFIVITTIFALLIIYFFISIYFNNHFFIGTYINGVNVSFKTVEEADAKLLNASHNYVLEIKERNDVIEYIEGDKINFEYKGTDKIDELKKKQNGFLWPKVLFTKNVYNINNVYSYEKTLLDEEFNKLACFAKENVIEPLDACFHYNGIEYEIIKEVYGNKVNKNYLYAYILNSVLIGTETIDLEEINAYEYPDFTSTSEKVIEAQKQLNTFVSTTVYYNFDDEIEILDGSIINEWLEVDQSMNVVLNEKKIKEYLNDLSLKYDTYGKTRTFKTTTGKTVEVVGGNYGWKIDKTKEFDELINNIKNGETIKKEPLYIQKAWGTRENDIGNTYVEINLTNQSLWFYKNGELIVQGDVVTGNVSRGNATPQGTYILNYKQKNATLKGAGYSSNVKYWMPFNCNIGIHDASWRGSFGGSIYKTDGSHGCVNAPEYLAKKIYENIEPGTPIICYKEE